MKFAKNLLNPHTYTKPRIFLCQTDKEKICLLETTETKASLKFNAYSEISFEVGRVYNDALTGVTLPNPFYDLIEAPRLIFVEGFGYFEIQSVEILSDGIKEAKNITAYSLEYTLSTKYLENFYINQGTVESLEVLNANGSNIVPIALYKPSNPKLSLLHLAIEKIYGWSIGHVDVQLQTLSRQFEIDRTSVYDFIMNEICEKFNCYVIFDTINNTINIYAEAPIAKFKGDGYTKEFIIGGVDIVPFSTIETVAIDGYKTTRWSYIIANGVGRLVLDEAPSDGAHIEVVGVDSTWETDVFVSFDNLIQEANVSYNVDDIRTVLTVTYGDDHDIREANLGLPYLTDISYFHTVEWMGQDLYDAYNNYVNKSNSYQTEYSKNSKEILHWNDRISYEEHRLSLEYSLANVSAETVGTYYIRVANYDDTYYYKEVSLPSDYNVNTQYYDMRANVNETIIGNLYDVLQEYACAFFKHDEERKVESLEELGKLEGFDYVEQYTLSRLINDLGLANTEDGMEAAVHRFLYQSWNELGRTPLTQMYLATYQKRRDSQLEAGFSVRDNDHYGSYYMSLVFINSINTAIAQREQTINECKAEQSVYSKANAEISNQLLMVNNFTEQQLIRLNAFLREDELHLDDFIETDLDDISSSMTLKQDAMESGRIELQKICQPRLQFSMTMANIYALHEFEPIVDQFQLGNIIRVGIRKDYIKQSRLLQANVNFDDFADFSCEFGELTSLRTQSDIHADLLSNAITAGKSVATHSSYWSKGSDTASAVENLINQGLLDATTTIKAIDGSQGVEIDKYGIHLRKIDPNTGAVDRKQGWIVNNQFLYSDDGFKSTKSVFGEFTIDGQSYYGILAEALVGNLIVGSSLKISGDGTALDITANSAINELNDQMATLNVTSDKIVSAVFDEDGSSKIEQTADAINLKVGYDEIIAAINMSEEGIRINANKLTIDASDLAIDASNIVFEGLVTANANFKILMDGSIEAKNATIECKITSTSGEIGEWIIASSGLASSDFSTCLFSIDDGISASIAGSDVKNDWRIISGGSLTEDYTFGVDKLGNVYASSVNLTGIINAIGGEIGGIEVDSTGLFYNGESGSDGFGLWKNGAHPHNNSNIIIHSGGNNDNIENASFRVYQNGDVVANSLTSSNATITGGSLKVGDNFSVDTSGIVKCISADIDGVVHLNNGSSIGVFKTDNNSIFSGTWGASGTTPPTVFMCTGSGNRYSIGGSESISGWAFGAGKTFGVTNDGALYASSGLIGGWKLSLYKNKYPSLYSGEMSTVMSASFYEDTSGPFDWDSKRLDHNVRLLSAGILVTSQLYKVKNNVAVLDDGYNNRTDKFYTWGHLTEALTAQGIDGFYPD